MLPFLIVKLSFVHLFVVYIFVRVFLKYSFLVQCSITRKVFTHEKVDYKESKNIILWSFRSGHFTLKNRQAHIL